MCVIPLGKCHIPYLVESKIRLLDTCTCTPKFTTWEFRRTKRAVQKWLKEIMSLYYSLCEKRHTDIGSSWSFSPCCSETKQCSQPRSCPLLSKIYAYSDTVLHSKHTPPTNLVVIHPMERTSDLLSATSRTKPKPGVILRLEIEKQL
jgi:hypothetical protein